MSVTMPRCRLSELFNDHDLRDKIRKKLPELFYRAELEVSRGGHAGMEVGILREQILIALLMYRFGKSAVKVPDARERGVDVYLQGDPISIKTVSIKGPGSIPPIKLNWTVDWQKVNEFVEKYEPKSDILLTVICWGSSGGMYSIPLSAQQDVLNQLGRNRYLEKPRWGRNPRGISLSRQALQKLIQHDETSGLSIEWKISRDRKRDRFWPYRRWLRYWMK